MRSSRTLTRRVAYPAAAALLAVSVARATLAAPAWGSAGQDDQAGPATSRSANARQEGADAASKAARDALATAPVRHKIGRMRGVRFISRVTFESAPDEPHELALSLAFPARSRLTLESAGGRRDRYQLGDTWFGQSVDRGAPAARGESFVLAGKDLDETRLDMALRRALFLWPDGAAFDGAGTALTAKVEGLGALLALVDDETGRPQSIRAIGRGGKVIAELRDIAWNVTERRAWPKSLVFAVGGKPLWSEVVERVEDEWLFADTWFLPSDRVAGMVGNPIDAPLRMRVVEEAWTTRLTLPAGTTRAEAVERALERWSSMRERLDARGLTLGPDVGIELDGRAAPIAIELGVPSSARANAALKGVKAWSMRDRRAAWMYLCQTLEDVDKSVVEAAAGAVAEGAEPDGPVVLRFKVTTGEAPEQRPLAATGLLVVQAFYVNDPDDGPGPGGR